MRTLDPTGGSRSAPFANAAEPAFGDASDRVSLSAIGDIAERLPPRLGERCGEPPSVALWISGAVLALPILLISRLRIDEGARGSRMLEVCINVRDANDESCTGRLNGPRRCHLVLRRHRVQPDSRVTCANLAVNSIAIAVPLDTSSLEAERSDKEVVSRGDVIADHQRYHLKKAGHSLRLEAVIPSVSRDWSNPERRAD